MILLRIKPAIFQEIAFQKHPLDRKVLLSLEEAALILANICTTSTAYQLGHKLVTINTEKQFNKQIFLPARTRIQSIVSQEIMEENNCFSSFKFSVYNFKYIQHLLQEQRISPKQVLNYCGLDVLLPLVELPQVFSFLERAYANLKSMKDDQKITILLEYYLKNERSLNLLRSRLEHPLPNLRTDSWEIQSF